MSQDAVPEAKKSMDEFELDGDFTCGESARSTSSRFGSMTQQMRQSYHGISRSLRKARVSISKALDASAAAVASEACTGDENASQRSPTPTLRNRKFPTPGSSGYNSSSLRNRTNFDGSISREQTHQSSISRVKRKDSHRYLQLSSSPPNRLSGQETPLSSPASKSTFFHSPGNSFQRKLEHARSSLSLTSKRMRSVEVRDSVERRPSSPILIGGGRVPILDLNLEQRTFSAMVSVDPRFELIEDSTTAATDTFVVGTPPRTPAPIDRNIPPTLIYSTASDASLVTNVHEGNGSPAPRNERRSTSQWSEEPGSFVNVDRLTEAVKNALESAFLEDPEPSNAKLAALAIDLGLSTSHVTFWFKEMRAALIRRSLLDNGCLRRDPNQQNGSQRDDLPSSPNVVNNSDGRLISFAPEDPFGPFAVQEPKGSAKHPTSNDGVTTGLEHDILNSLHDKKSFEPFSSANQAQTIHDTDQHNRNRCHDLPAANIEVSVVLVTPEVDVNSCTKAAADSLSVKEYVRRICIVNGRPVSILELRSTPHDPASLTEESNTGTKTMMIHDLAPQPQMSDTSRGGHEPEVNFGPLHLELHGFERKSKLDNSDSMRNIANIHDFVNGNSSRSVRPPNGRTHCLWLPFEIPLGFDDIVELQNSINDGFLQNEVFTWDSKANGMVHIVVRDQRKQPLSRRDSNTSSPPVIQALPTAGQTSTSHPDRRLRTSYELYRNGDLHPNILPFAIGNLEPDEDYGSDNRYGRNIKLPELKHRIFAKVVEGKDPEEFCVSLISDEYQPNVQSLSSIPAFDELPPNKSTTVDMTLPASEQEGHLRGGWTQEQLTNNDDLYEISDQDQEEDTKPRVSIFNSKEALEGESAGPAFQSNFAGLAAKKQELSHDTEKLKAHLKLDLSRDRPAADLKRLDHALEHLDLPGPSCAALASKPEARSVCRQSSSCTSTCHDDPQLIESDSDSRLGQSPGRLSGKCGSKEATYDIAVPNSVSCAGQGNEEEAPLNGQEKTQHEDHRAHDGCFMVAAKRNTRRKAKGKWTPKTDENSAPATRQESPKQLKVTFELPHRPKTDHTSNKRTLSQSERGEAAKGGSAAEYVIEAVASNGTESL